MDRNCQFSTLMQAVVDHRMKFLHVATGFPGSIHDLRVLSLSTLWQNRRSYFNGPEIVLPGSGIEIEEYIVGDAGYVICENIMTPIKGTNLDIDEDKFNTKLSQTRIIVERAFGKWKQTWAFFDSKIKRPQLRSLYHYMNAACILHNMLVEFRELDTSEDSTFVPVAVTETSRSYGYSTFLSTLQRDEMMEYVLKKV